MQENNTRLVDESLIYEPVKNTFLLSWEWMKLNKQFIAMTLGIYVLFNLVGISFVATMFAIVMQIYIGRIFYESMDISTYVDAIKKSNAEKLLSKNIAPAIGGYLGWIVLMTMVMLVVVVFVSSTYDISTLDLQSLKTVQDIEANIDILIPFFIAMSIPALVIMLVLLYIKPLVDANIVMSHTFKEGFLAVFTSFSADLWRKSLRGDYFYYVSKLGIVMMLMMFPFALLVSVIGINILTYIIMFVLLYISNIIMTVASMMLKRMVE